MVSPKKIKMQKAAQQAMTLFESNRVLSERIVFYRNQKGKTQEDVATDCGVHRIMVARWEGKNGKPLSMLLANAIRLSKSIGIPLATLLKGIDI